MKSIVLSEEEIESIKSFVNDAKNNDVVECVYFVPYTFTSPYTDHEKEDVILVIAVWSNNLRYNVKLTGIETMRDVKEELLDLDVLVNDYKDRRSSDSRLNYMSDAGEDYSLSMMHKRELLAEREIVCGTILFDRFGDMAKNKEAAAKYLKPYPEILEVENLTELMEGLKEESVLGK